MPIVGSPRNYKTKFNFVVEIDGVVHAGFMKCSSLEAEFDEIVVREGGGHTPVTKDPGLLNFSDITLERGAVHDDSDLYRWFVEVGDYASNRGLKNPAFKRSFDIVELDRDGEVLNRHRCAEAWVKKFVAGEWDNDSSEPTIEMVTLSIRGFRRLP